MLTDSKTVSAAEIAFMAGLTDKEINRLVDDEVLPGALVLRDHGRRFAPLTAAFADFYFNASADLTRSARMRVITTLTERLRSRPDFDRFLLLDRPQDVDFDWSVSHAAVTVFLTTYVIDAWTRAERVTQAARHIVEDPAVLGGTPCFKGTRVPVANVVAASEDGIPFAELKSAYPFLTEALLDDAATYVKARPRAGRPRRLNQSDQELTLIRRKVVRAPREDA